MIRTFGSELEQVIEGAGDKHKRFLLAEMAPDHEHHVTDDFYRQAQQDEYRHKLHQYVP